MCVYICSIRSVGNGISIEKSRPAGLNSLIACNSYKSQAWPKKETTLQLGPFSRSYGAAEIIPDEKINGLFLQGVA